MVRMMTKFFDWWGGGRIDEKCVIASEPYGLVRSVQQNLVRSSSRHLVSRKNQNQERQKTLKTRDLPTKAPSAMHCVGGGVTCQWAGGTSVGGGFIEVAYPWGVDFGPYLGDDQ